MNKSIIISGSGGQGVLSIGTILANIFMLNDLYVTLCSSYGAEMRGGAVNCQINVSDNEINEIQNNKVDYIIALNQTSLNKFISRVKSGGTIIINSSLAKVEELKEDIKYIFLPFTQQANSLGNIKMTNSIALGALSKLLGGFNEEKIKNAYQKVLSNKIELIENNIKAYNLGFNGLQEEK
ncbi:MAG: 2-oxoacid:acceptor oxidoreductase family protein [Candidatus Gastranaerophilales bacterium]|nr:2-oxoacid:acceptor oxidoreductase family protein [Candidatus Gastranaerophilales bacterium]